MRRLIIVLLVAVPSLAQEVFVHPIPPGCTCVVVPATPTVAGTATITCPPLKLTNPSVLLPAGKQNSPYSVNLATLTKPTGGVQPYAFRLNATPVPPSWLKLSLAGMVTGTPTATGTVNFSFTASDSSAKLTQAGQGSLNVKHGPIHAVVNYRTESEHWGVWIGGKFYETSDCPATGCVLNDWSSNAR